MKLFSFDHDGDRDHDHDHDSYDDQLPLISQKTRGGTAKSAAPSFNAPLRQLAVMRNAERFLTAIEDERHDQILLVIEMADQPFDQRPACIRIFGAVPAKRVGIGPQRLQQRIGGLCGARHVGVDVVMVAFEDIKSTR